MKLIEKIKQKSAQLKESASKSLDNTKQIIKNLIANLKEVLKDKVHLIMACVAVVLVVLDLFNVHIYGACVFLGFYVSSLLIALGNTKRRLNENI